LRDTCIDILRADPCATSIMTEWLSFFRQRYPDIDVKKNSLEVWQTIIAAMSPNFYSIGILYLAYGTGMGIDVLHSRGSITWTALHTVLQFGDKMDPLLLKTKLGGYSYIMGQTLKLALLAVARHMRLNEKQAP
jgi:biotin transporter BioY